MQATARMACVVSSAHPDRRRLFRDVRCLSTRMRMSINSEPIMSYPDRSYSLDYPNQLRMDLLMTRRTRITGGLIFGSVAVLICFAATGWKPFGFAWFPIMLAGVIHGMRRAPALRCTTCGQRMRRESVSCGSDEEEFLVCEPCRRYTFNHRRSISG